PDRQSSGRSAEVHGGRARFRRDGRPPGRGAAGRVLGIPLQPQHRREAARRRLRRGNGRRAVLRRRLQRPAPERHGDRLPEQLPGVGVRLREPERHRRLMLLIVATDTSALTVISVPGIAARGDLTFLQIAFGYLVGRIGVARLLLPGYFEGTQDTAYQRLERRFGSAARRTASGVFLLTRALADCVRIFATAIPLAIITHWSLAAGILAIGIVTLIYTWVGGLRAVVWVDVIQLGVYLLGGIATFV